MEKLLISGGRSLSGNIAVKSAKNAILPIMAASLLAEGDFVLFDCPDISDIRTMGEMLKELGANFGFENGNILLNTENANKHIIGTELAKELRSSIFLLGGVLGRCGKAVIPYPGGCDIGLRPINIHLKGFGEMGVRVEERHGLIYCDSASKHAADITLDYPSVGATENLMILATVTPGQTTIRNVAKEPEIVDLQNFLNKMGGRIKGAGSGIISVEGRDRLSSVEYSPIPDRIVAGTVLLAAAMCGGKVTIERCVPEHLASLLYKLNKTTCNLRCFNDSIAISSSGRQRAIDHIETQPYPGFPTDLQAQAMAFATIADGVSIIVENVFETRFKHARELMKMGASITVKDRTAIVRGKPMLTGAYVTAGDLRGGAALVLAGLSAEGYTTVGELKHIDRGYEKIEQTFSMLGGDIKRINEG